MPRSPAVLLALLLVLVGAAYARGLANQFAYDDRHYVMAPGEAGPNDMVGRWQGLRRYFTSYYGETAVVLGRGFRPTTVMSFALVNAVFGTADPASPPVAQRLVNVLLHLLATWLIAVLIARVVGSPWPALVGAAVFGCHALRSDPVLSLVGRAEVLAFVFGVAGTLAADRAVDRRGLRRLAWSSGAACCLFLAFGAKESALAWIAFVPLYVGLRRRRSSDDGSTTPTRSAWMAVSLVVILPLLVFLPLWLPIVTARELPISVVNNPLIDCDLGTRLRSALVVAGHGLGQSLAPFWLHVDYSFDSLPLAESWGDLRFLASAAVLVGALIAGTRFGRRHPAVFLGTAMYFGFAATTANLVVRIETIYGERLMYTPAAGLSLVVAWLAQQFARRAPRFGKVLLVVLGAWLVACLAVVVMRCGVWHDNTTLFIHEAATQPHSQRMQMAAGRGFRIEGESLGFAGPRGEECLRRWVEYLHRALHVHPDADHPLPLNDLAYMHLGRRDALLSVGDATAAIREEDAAAARIAQALASPRFRPEHGETLYFLRSRIHERRGDRRAQLADLKLSRDSKPWDPEPHLRLARHYAAARQRNEVVEVLRVVDRRFPNLASLRVQALDLLDDVGAHEEFEAMLSEGERRLPGDPYLALFRAVALSRSGQHYPALASVQKVLRHVPTPPPRIWLAVATSLAAIGDRAQAVRVLRERLADPRATPATRSAMQSLLQRLEK
ncbi:MAG: hypothetical protein H6837_14160 [Planctomycetes bacterium]|nr:hypothetical protein [Planctomycetota bacterium]